MKGTGKVLREGRVTIPKPIRDQLEIEYGDYVVLDVVPVDDLEG